MYTFLFIITLILYIIYLFIRYKLLPYYTTMFQQVTKVVSYYFCAIFLLPYYFFTQNHAA